MSLMKIEAADGPNTCDVIVFPRLQEGLQPPTTVLLLWPGQVLDMVTCGVWSVECGVWSVEFRVWSVEFGV